MLHREGCRTIIAVCLAAALWPAGAWAQAVLVESRTEAQVYQVRSFRGTDPANPVLLPRRRLVSFLSLDGFELITGQDLSFESSLRVFADFGVSPGEPSRVDGLKAVDAELMLASVSYRVAGFEGRLGRQVWWDALDAFALDGLRVRYTSPWRVGVEAYAGLWVKGQSFAASPVYQLDGVRESDARRLTLGIPEANPLLDELEPVVGGRLFVVDLAGVSAGVQYRRAMLEDRITFERLGAEARYQSPRFPVSLFSAADFDLVTSQLANLRAEVRYDASVFSVSAQVSRSSPVLSTDSIWYWFNYAPRDEAQLRGDFFPGWPVRFYGRAVLSRFAPTFHPNIELSALNGTLVTWSPGASGGAVAAVGDLSSALDVTWRNGDTGRSFWVDLNGGWTPAGRPWSLGARLAFADVKDRVQPRLTGRYLGGQLWGGYALSDRARLSLILEHNRSEGRPPDTKAFATFAYQLALGRGRR